MNPLAIISGLPRHTRVALVFLTQLPVQYPDGESRPLAAHVAGFPVAGLLVGILVSLALAGTDAIGLPAPISAVFAVAAAVLITRALHEDGLADTVDGFGGGTDKTHRLEIMRDSHIGAFGVIALVISLLMRAVCIFVILQATGIWSAVYALIAAHALSRSAVAWMMYDLPPARINGRSHEAGRPEVKDARHALIIGGGLGAICILNGFGLGGLVLVFVSIAIGYVILKRLAVQKIGGQTGDVLGACQQLTEVAAVLALCVNL